MSCSYSAVCVCMCGHALSGGNKLASAQAFLIAHYTAPRNNPQRVLTVTQPMHENLERASGRCSRESDKDLWHAVERQRRG